MVIIPKSPQNRQLTAIVRKPPCLGAGARQKAARRVLSLVDRAVAVIVVPAILVVNVLVYVFAGFSACIVAVVPIIRTTHTYPLLALVSRILLHFAVKVNEKNARMLLSFKIVR